MTDSKYDFAGLPLRRRETVRPTSSSPADTLDVRHRYDHRGRLLHTETLLNGRDTVLVWHEYDAVGRLAATTLGEGAGAPRTDYRYNLRGWLTGQRSDLFSASLAYESPALPGTEPSYSGNISEWSWQGGTDDDTKSYAFAYDGLARLTSSSLFENGRQTDRFVERGITYDPNGNILALERTGNGTVANDLAYTYDGNRLVSQQTGATAIPMIRTVKLIFSYAPHPSKVSSTIRQEKGPSLSDTGYPGTRPDLHNIHNPKYF